MIYPIRSIDQAIVAATGTVTPAYDPFVNLIRLTTSGSVTLSSSFSLNLTNYEVSPIYIPVYFEGVITLGAFSFTIAGVSIEQDLVNQRGMFHCFFDGTSWKVYYNADGKDQPQIERGVANINVPAGGGTRTLVAGVNKEYERLDGTVTLTSNYTISASVSGVKDGATFVVIIGGGITLNGNTLTVFGISISAFDALNGGAEVQAVYSSASNTWRATYVNKPIAVGNIQSVAALTVLANGTNATAAPSALAFSSSLQVLTRIGSVLAPAFLTPDHLVAGGMVAFASESYPIGVSDVLDLFATPLPLLPAPRPGRIWNMMNPVMKLTYGTTPYATNTDLAIRYVGATNPIFIATGALAATGTGVVNFVPVEGEIIEGATLEVYVPGGNPTAGDSTIRIYFDVNEKLLA
jgi:hypothetical protein